MKNSAIVRLFSQTFHEWGEDKASRLAAALSYYTIFSLAPLLVIAIAVAGFVWGRQAAQGAIVGQIQGLVGQSGAQQVQTMIQNASKPAAGIIATVISVIILLVGASGVFTALQDSMNTIFEVELKPGQGIWAMIRERFLSFALVLGIGFLLLVSLVVSAALSAVTKFVAGALPFSGTIIQLVNFLISFLVITFLFVLTFKLVPDAKIAWRDVWLGAAVTALLFTIGKSLIGLYLGRASVTGVFGAAGSLIVLLLWVYYSGQILFLGAEFTQVFARKYGRGIQPKPNAQLVTEIERAHQGIPHRERTPRAQPAAGQAQGQPQPAMARTAVPRGAAVPVTGESTPPRNQVVEAALPAAVALLIGISGSVAIAREQRKRPIVKKKE